MIIIPTYINCNNWESDFENLYEFLLMNDNPNVLVVGDFNARIAAEAGFENEVVEIARQSKDGICIARGKQFLDLCDTFGLRILNGTSTSDKDGEFT